MYEAVTRGIRIRVTPQYLEDQSSPEESEFFWAYTIEIANESDETVQLRSRVWRITDARRPAREEVRGPGVVGETPVIQPGSSFSYTSGCPLRTPSGIMVGSYQMTDAKGELFDVAIPAFSLDSPFVVRQHELASASDEGTEPTPRRSCWRASSASTRRATSPTWRSSVSSRTICCSTASSARSCRRADGQKASLYATIGPAGVAGVALSGHTDVVPVDGPAVDVRSVHASPSATASSTAAALPT